MAIATLADLIADVRSRCDEPTSQFWTDVEITRYLNTGLRDIARRTETLQGVKAYTTVVGQVQYDAPSDMLRIHRIEYVQTASYRIPLEFQPLLSIDDFWFNRTSTGIPKWWSFWGFPGTQDRQQLYIWPAPSQAIVNGLLVFYYRLPKIMASNNDPAEIPAGWEDLPALYAEQSARRKDGVDNRWKEVEQLYESRLGQMLEMTRHWSDQMTFVSGNSDNMGGLPSWLYGGDD